MSFDAPDPVAPLPNEPPTSPPVAPPGAPPVTPQPAPAAEVPAAEVPAAYPPPYGASPVPLETTSRTSNNAIVALILSILSFVVCPLFLAIGALILASAAKKEIAASDGRVNGSGMVTASKVLAWINIACVVFVIGVGVAFMLSRPDWAVD